MARKSRPSILTWHTRSIPPYYSHTMNRIVAVLILLLVSVAADPQLRGTPQDERRLWFGWNYLMSEFVLAIVGSLRMVVQLWLLCGEFIVHCVACLVPMYPVYQTYTMAIHPSLTLSLHCRFDSPTASPSSSQKEWFVQFFFVFVIVIVVFLRWLLQQ